MISIDTAIARNFVSDEVYNESLEKCEKALVQLKDKSGEGSEWLGWRDLLKSPNDALLEKISSLGRDIRNNGDILNTVAPAKWTLVGNPYPSAIDALDLIHDPQNTSSINGVLYYWEQQPGNGSTGSHYIADYVGGYASYTCLLYTSPSPRD